MIAELVPLDMKTMTGEDSTRLWDHVKSQDICFDDLTRGRGDYFAQRLIAANTLAFEYPEGVLALVENIVPKLQADVHFFIWNAIPESDLARLGRELCGEIMHKFELNRMSTYIPAMNKLGCRIATRVGFKFEGNMRQLFLYKKVYHDVFVYGLVKHEFETLRGVL